MCLLAVIFGAFIVYRLYRLSDQMTHQIIRLYENLEQITADIKKGTKTASGAKQAATTLSFKKSNKELNDLQITFNKVAKSLQIATQAETQGNSAQALLNYHEAYSTYQEYDNVKEQGVCLNNIGSIFMKRKEYDKAESYFKKAAED